MIFQNIRLGDVGIGIQNVETFNQDVYKIGAEEFQKDGARMDVEAIINKHMEEPERFVVYPEADGVSVYTKQPEAVVQMAMYLNDARGATVSDKELEAVHEHLVKLQDQHTHPWRPLH
jgi:hypothetical protein